MWVQMRVGSSDPLGHLHPASLSPLCPTTVALFWPFLAIVSPPPGQPVPMESEGELCQGHCLGDGE